MTCKNCEANLRTDYLYCPNCGGKVIRNRITVKNLWFDVLDRYFNLDNTFINTFVHLFTKPEVVIEGYLQGLRRKYLNPISYLGLALTLSGIIVFLMTKSIDFMAFDMFDNESQTVFQKKMLGYTMDYQALLFIVYIPLMAIAGWLCFDEKKYNFAERNIIFMYSLAHFSLFSFIPSVIVLLFTPEHYMTYSLLGSLTMLIYTSYVVARISKAKGIMLFAKLILFYLILSILYFAISLIIPLLMFLTGEVTLDDFQPKNG